MLRTALYTPRDNSLKLIDFKSNWNSKMLVLRWSLTSQFPSTIMKKNWRSQLRQIRLTINEQRLWNWRSLVFSFFLFYWFRLLRTSFADNTNESGFETGKWCVCDVTRRIEKPSGEFSAVGNQNGTLWWETKYPRLEGWNWRVL